MKDQRYRISMSYGSSTLSYPPINYPRAPLVRKEIVVYESFCEEIYSWHREINVSWRRFWFHFAKRLDFFLPEEDYRMTLFRGTCGQRRMNIRFKITEADWERLLQTREKLRLRWNEFMFLGLYYREPDHLFARKMLQSESVNRFMKKAIRDFLDNKGKEHHEKA